MTTQPPSLSVVEQKEVLFYEDTLTAVRASNGIIYVPVRPICDLLGVDWPAQRKRIARDPVLGPALQGMVVTTTPGGAQVTSCLPLDLISGFLFGMNASRVRPELSERLIRYQRECYKVLAEAFQEGRLTGEGDLESLLQRGSPAAQAYQMLIAMTRLARNQLLLESRLEEQSQRLDTIGARLEQIESVLGGSNRTVSEAQASEISQAVKAVANELGKRSGRNEYGGVYGELYRRFGITSYKQLPAGRFQEALGFLNNWYQGLVDSATLF